LPTHEEFFIAVHLAPSEFKDMGVALMDSLDDYLPEETLEAIQTSYTGFTF